ncbi:hypothetical protein K491DRAFT_458172 [Lophiostoma macrostomum CBS 122681]|uniref:Uncharacterized protein n=1 Tax=Lophiostoma macrostomum CBS 122681 TaxID=1314788 RepID=A0A6A6T8C5_9PLEO|nr:hypothetical protein K491DRAFT_458172 [Lophiostoma macrostomum CBS 122681]
MVQPKAILKAILCGAYCTGPCTGDYHRSSKSETAFHLLFSSAYISTHLVLQHLSLIDTSPRRFLIRCARSLAHPFSSGLAPHNYVVHARTELRPTAWEHPAVFGGSIVDFQANCNSWLYRAAA